MASSLVVVGADVGGQRELVVPECGYLVRPGDKNAEVEQYCAVLCECLDSPEARESKGRAAAERIAEGFSLDEMADRMIELVVNARERHQAIERPRLTPSYVRETATMALEYTRVTLLADQLWQSREEHLGLEKSWRGAVFGFAYRMALRTPPGVQRRLAEVYNRFVVRQRRGQG